MCVHVHVHAHSFAVACACFCCTRTVKSQATPPGRNASQRPGPVNLRQQQQQQPVIFTDLLGATPKALQTKAAAKAKKGNHVATARQVPGARGQPTKAPAPVAKDVKGPYPIKRKGGIKLAASRKGYLQQGCLAEITGWEFSPTDKKVTL